jgi:hypothetical protein
MELICGMCVSARPTGQFFTLKADERDAQDGLDKRAEQA